MNDHFSFRWGIHVLDKLKFVPVYDFLLDSYAELGISPAEMMFIIHLSQFHFESERGRATPSLATIGKRMGYADAQMPRRLAKSLKQKGMLEVIDHGSEGKPNEYNFAGFSRRAWEIWLRKNDQGTIHYDTPVQSYSPIQNDTPSPIQEYSPPLYASIGKEKEEKNQNPKNQRGGKLAPLAADAAPAPVEKKADDGQSKKRAPKQIDAAPVADNLQSPKPPSKAAKHQSLLAQFDATGQQAIKLYQAAFGRYPNEIQMRDIAEKVRDLDRWQQVLDDWQLNGWNCASVGKMTARYQKPMDRPNQRTDTPGRRRGVLSGDGDAGPKIDKSKLAFLQPSGGGAHG
ncbi:MAG TPA: hypothetical protein VFZ66_29710 [Herpetosiphonaceae bacterium]